MSESALIQRFLDAQNSADENALLSTLIFDNAAPIIRRTISRRLTTSPTQEREDVAGDVILQLLTHLKNLKQRAVAPSIASPPMPPPVRITPAINFCASVTRSAPA